MLEQDIEKIEFIALATQQKRIRKNIEIALHQVLDHGQYIFGPEVSQLENALCDATKAKHTITCANGTEALSLVLMAHNLKPNDAVLVPTFTFASTAEVVARANAIPVFVDVCPKTFNLSVESAREAIQSHPTLNFKGIIAVDLYGLPADYDAIHQFAQEHGLWLIGDAAQSFGGAIRGHRVGTLAPVTTTSFFPSKPLSCYGDGGAIFTDDPELTQTLISMRNHGCGKHRYDHVHVGLNSRLDSLQAAILIEKLKIFDEEHRQRTQIATQYHALLSSCVQTPTVPSEYTHAYGLYSVVCPQNTRENIIASLKEEHVPTNIYYHKPLHLQPAYQHFPRAQSCLQHAEYLSQHILSLPMHPYLTPSQVDYIGHRFQEAIARC